MQPAQIAILEGDPSVVEQISEFLKPEMDAVNSLIAERLSSHVPLAGKVARHIIMSGGKRIRPILTLLASKMLGGHGERPIALATCVEFIHTATLLHDDVIDESSQRRGAPSANAMWGNKASVLVGDFLFSRAFELMVADGHPEILARLAQASSIMAQGEVLQLSVQGDLAVPIETYFQIIDNKAAELFSAACAVGGMVAHGTPQEVQALSDFGRALGIIFQITDDILDYTATSHKMGKNTGDDFYEGKMTLPSLLAFHEGDATEKTFWRRAITDRVPPTGGLPQAQHYLQKHRIEEKCREYARHYAARAHTILQTFPPSESKELWAGLIEYCLVREC